MAKCSGSQPVFQQLSDQFKITKQGEKNQTKKTAIHCVENLSINDVRSSIGPCITEIPQEDEFELEKRQERAIKIIRKQEAHFQRDLNERGIQ